MNLRRGFHRITCVLAIVGAIFCAACAVLIVGAYHESENDYLQWKQDSYRERADSAVLPEGFVLEKPQELQELEGGFWVTLPAWGLVGLCILAGLGGAAVGYFSTWIIVWFGGLAVYKLIMWIVLGFRDDKG